MSDELSPEMLEEAAPDLLTLEDEDGKEVTFEVIDATEVNGTRYRLSSLSGGPGEPAGGCRADPDAHWHRRRRRVYGHRGRR